MSYLKLCSLHIECAQQSNTQILDSTYKYNTVYGIGCLIKYCSLD